MGDACHFAICDDETYMSEHIKTRASDFFRRKNREITIQIFSSGEELQKYDGQLDILFSGVDRRYGNGKETSSIVLQYMRNI